MSPFNSKMSYDEAISSTILSEDVSIIADIYNIIKMAGLEASTDPEVIAVNKDVRVIPANKPGENRKSVEAKQVRGTYEITYDANDITIVGGGALNIYDYKLKALKERRELASLEEYIKKKTSDIDIVWWPRTKTTNPIITTRSEAIIKLVLAFKTKLITKFEEKKKALESRIRPFITNATNADNLTILFEMIPVYPAGVFNINIMFQMKGVNLKMCDVIVHDSGASQRFDRDGKEITDVRFMESDPMYSFPNPGKYNSLTYLNVNGIDIAVPNIKTLIKQQIFAFENILRAKMIKSFINYKRIQFIKKLLLSFKLNATNNTQNFGELIEVFGTDQREYPEMVANEIDAELNESILKSYHTIIELCGTVNISRDPLVTELCAKAKSIAEGPKINTKELDAYRQREIIRLGELKESVYKEVKAAPKPLEKQFRNVHRALDDRRIALIRMPLQELVGYKEYFNNNPDKELQEIERLHEELSKYRNRANKRGLLPAPPAAARRAPAIAPMQRMPAAAPQMQRAPGPSVPQFIPLAATPPTAVPVYFDPASGRYVRYNTYAPMYAPPPLPPGPPPQPRYIIHHYPPGTMAPPGPYQQMQVLPLPQQQHHYGRGKTRKQTNRGGTRKKY
jgi:hypothetical protein